MRMECGCGTLGALPENETIWRLASGVNSYPGKKGAIAQPQLALGSRTYNVPTYPALPKVGDFPLEIRQPFLTRNMAWYSGYPIVNVGYPTASNDWREYLRSAMVDSDWDRVEQFVGWYLATQTDRSQNAIELFYKVFNFGIYKWVADSTRGPGGKKYLPFSPVDYRTFFGRLKRFESGKDATKSCVSNSASNHLQNWDNRIKAMQNGRIPMPLTIGFCPKPVSLTKALIFVAAPLLVGAAFAYLPAFAAAPAAAPGAAGGVAAGGAAGGAAAGSAAAGGAAAAGGVAAGGAAASGAITALETITVTGAAAGAGGAATAATLAAGAVAPWASQNVFGSQFTGQQSVNPSDFGAQQAAPQFKEQILQLAKEQAIDYGTDYAMQKVGEYYAEKLQAKMAAEQEAALRAELDAAQREYEALLAAGKTPAAARQEAVQSGKFGMAMIAVAALAAILLMRR